MEQAIWISARPNVAAKKRIMAYTETILGQKSACRKRLEPFALIHHCGTSAFDDGFEAAGFEVVAGVCGGLGVTAFVLTGSTPHATRYAQLRS